MLFLWENQVNETEFNNETYVHMFVTNDWNMHWYLQRLRVRGAFCTNYAIVQTFAHSDQLNLILQQEAAFIITLEPLRWILMATVCHIRTMFHLERSWKSSYSWILSLDNLCSEVSRFCRWGIGIPKLDMLLTITSLCFWWGSFPFL